MVSQTPQHTAASPTTPSAAASALNSLLEAELNSIFRFMGKVRAPSRGRSVRKPLQEMVIAEKLPRGRAGGSDRLARQRSVPMVGIRRDEQYLASRR